MIRALIDRLLRRKPKPTWTAADEAELIRARRHHRPRAELESRKRQALHADLARASGWRGLVR